MVVVGVAYLNRGDGEATWTVVVAKQRIPAGTLLKPSMYELVTVPQGEVEVGTLTDVKYLALYRVAHPIYPGRVLAASDFSP